MNDSLKLDFVMFWKGKPNKTFLKINSLQYVASDLCLIHDVTYSANGIKNCPNFVRIDLHWLNLE